VWGKLESVGLFKVRYCIRKTMKKINEIFEFSKWKSLYWIGMWNSNLNRVGVKPISFFFSPISNLYFIPISHPIFPFKSQAQLANRKNTKPKRKKSKPKKDPIPLASKILSQTKQSQPTLSFPTCHHLLSPCVSWTQQLQKTNHPTASPSVPLPLREHMSPAELTLPPSSPCASQH